MHNPLPDLSAAHRLPPGAVVLAEGGRDPDAALIQRARWVMARWRALETGRFAGAADPMLADLHGEACYRLCVAEAERLAHTRAATPRGVLAKLEAAGTLGREVRDARPSRVVWADNPSGSHDTLFARAIVDLEALAHTSFALAGA